MKNKREIVQIIKYLAAGLSVTALQFILVNILPFAFSSWKTPLLGFLARIFSEDVMGKGNSSWGYVMTFLLSNIAANIYGYFLNRKTVFHSDSPSWCFVVFTLVMVTLILFSTWLQGVIANSVKTNLPSLSAFANTIAAAACGFLQNLIVFPLEKFVLLRERKRN